MITKMKKLTFLIYHKDYECFLQSVRDLGVVHVAEKAQGTAENAELQESIRLSDRYASTIKFLQGFNAELQEQEGECSNDNVDNLADSNAFDYSSCTYRKEDSEN